MSLYSSTIAADAPLAYWRLGDLSGTTAADNSGNARNLAYSGGYILDSGGAIASDSNAAVTYDGSTGMASGAISFGLTATYAFECWVYYAGSASGSLVYPFALTQGVNKIAAIGMSGTYSQSDIAVQSIYLFDGTSASSSAAHSFDLSTIGGGWHHIAVTYNAAGSPKTQFYLDGAPLGMFSDTASGSMAAQDTTSIGQFVGNGGVGWTGKLDEVAVYASISATRIKAHYNAGIASLRAARMFRSSIIAA